MGRKRVAIAAGGLIVVVALAWIFHNAVTQAAVRTVAGAIGYGLSFERFDVGLTSAKLVGPRIVNRAGEPVFQAEQVDLGYSLRDALPGGKRRFGLTYVDVQRPQMTVIHHPDGTYNLAIPTIAGPKKQQAAPLNVRLRIRDGSVAMIDRYTAYPQERRQRIEGVALDAVLSPTEHSFYNARFDLNDGHRRYPVTGFATFDDARGYESQRWFARRLPIGPLVDFALSSHAINLTAGDLYDVELRVFGLTNAQGAMEAHIRARAQLRGGKIYFAGLDKPLRNAGGEVDITDNAIVTPRLDASIADVPVVAAGGIYDFSSPTLRVGAHGHGDLAKLRRVSAAAADRPISGPLDFHMLAEGPLSKPLVFAGFSSPRIGYRSLSVVNPHGVIAVEGQELDIVGAALRYGPVDLTIHGSMLLQTRLAATIVAAASGPSDRLPYAAQIVPHMPLRGVAVARGTDREIGFKGILDGATGMQRLGAIASVAPGGVGSVGPITIDGPNGRSLYARVELDRPGDVNMIVVGANHFTVRPGTIAALPGLPVNRLPPIDAVLDGNIVALQHGAGLEYLGGRASIGPAHVAGVAINRVRAEFNGDVAQVDEASLGGGALAGIPISSVRATIGLHPDRYDVLAARARIAGGTLLAQGTFGDDKGELLADLSGADPSSLRRFGLPVQGGRVHAVARIGGTLSAPRATVGALLSGGRISRSPLEGSVDLAYAGDRLDIRHSTVMLGGAYGAANGTVTGIRRGDPRYDVDAQMRAADVATLADALHLGLPYPEGTIDADLHLGGAGKAPAFNGDVQIAEASLNGLAFHGATRFAGDSSGIIARNGSIVVGSSALRFNADVGAAHQAVALRGDAVDLSDFNDFFDVADTLHGKGSVSVAVDRSPSALGSNGRVAIRDLRYKRFPIGDTNAAWNTNGNTVVARADVLGKGGRLHVDGNAGVGSVRRTSVDVRAFARDLNLNVWLPAAGITAPVVGLVDADARVRGPLAAPLMSATAALRNGIVAGIPIDRFTVAASANRGQARIASATLEIPHLSATASGTFGLGPNAPLAIVAQAMTPDVGALAKVFGKTYPIAGALTSTLRATGTLRAPSVVDTLDLTGFRYENFQVPHAHTEVAYGASTLDVKDGTIDLRKGALDFDARFPLSIAGFAFRSVASPLRGRIAARGIDLSSFAPLLPKGTKLAGVVDGTVNVGGTLSSPLMDGAVALSRGYYVSRQEKTALANGSVGLQFSGTTATLSRAHFDVGRKGTLDASGRLRVADLRDPLHALGFDLTAVAKAANFNLPQYFNGQIDGTLHATQTPGGVPLVAGDVDVSHARIPFAAILAETKAKRAGAPPPNIALDLNLAVGPDVRVQGPNLDVGGAGAIAFGGTLAAPKLSGQLASTGGSVDFYRNFNIQEGSVTFTGDSLIPDLNVVATTFVAQPSTEVHLRMSGPATAMNLALSSNPPYDRAQILGLLIGGARFAGLNGLETAEGPPPPSPFQGITNGYIDTLFTRNFLEPFETSLGSALGLQNLQLNYDLAGNEGFSATVRHNLGKNMALQFASTYGFPSRTTIALMDELNNDSALRFSIFSTYGQQGLGYYAPYLTSQPGTNISLQASQPAAGEQGFSIQYVRHFK